MIWDKVLWGVGTGSLLSLIGGLAATPAGSVLSAQTRGDSGFAYICDGPAQVQEVKEYSGEEVFIVDNVERPNSPNGMFEIFQTSGPEECSSMTAPSTGAVPGTLLVAVTWATPPPQHCQAVNSRTTSKVQGQAFGHQGASRGRELRVMAEVGNPHRPSRLE